MKNFSALKSYLMPSLVAVASILLIAACDDEAKQAAAKEKAIMEELNNRLESWHAEIERTCIQQAYDEASRIVDSMLIATAKLQRDSTGKLFLPPRPEKPEFGASPDSITVEPLLKFRKDTFPRPY
jgi:hypothetical protein